MEWLILPLSILAMAFLFNGFPDINIGTKTVIKKCKDDDDDDDDYYDDDY